MTTCESLGMSCYEEPSHSSRGSRNLDAEPWTPVAVVVLAWCAVSPVCPWLWSCDMKQQKALSFPDLWGKSRNEVWFKCLSCWLLMLIKSWGVASTWTETSKCSVLKILPHILSLPWYGYFISNLHYFLLILKFFAI